MMTDVEEPTENYLNTELYRLTLSRELSVDSIICNYTVMELLSLWISLLSSGFSTAII